MGDLKKFKLYQFIARYLKSAIITSILVYNSVVNMSHLEQLRDGEAAWYFGGRGLEFSW